MKLSPSEIKTLQALRAGEMETSELMDRFPSGYASGSLLKKGLIEDIGMGYRITAEGKQACPTRRSIELPTLKPKLQTSVAAPIEVANIERKKEDEIMNTDIKPNALLMLEYIEQHPACTMLEMQAGLNNTKIGKGNIVGYLDRGHVVINSDAAGKKTYSIAAGLKVNDFYGALKHKDVTTQEPAKTESAFQSAESTHDHVPAFVKAPVIDIAPSTFTKSTFRVAYTSDGCLLIMGVQYMPIELDAAQTRELIDYVDDLNLSEVA